MPKTPRARTVHVDLDDPAVVAERNRIFAPNIWPSEVPALRRVLQFVIVGTVDMKSAS